MDVNFIGKWIQVQSYKHDSSLHRTWDNAMVIECNEDYIAIASTMTKVIEADGRRWFTREPAVSIFFFKEWFNVIAMIKERNEIFYYCNIASPSIVHNNTIKYIDYDLDLKLLPDNKIVELDVKEYDFHRKKYHYSNDLDKVCWHVFKKVNHMMIDRVFPFDDLMIKKMYKNYEELIQLQHKGMLDS